MPELTHVLINLLDLSGDSLFFLFTLSFTDKLNNLTNSTLFYSLVSSLIVGCLLILNKIQTPITTSMSHAKMQINHEFCKSRDSVSYLGFIFLSLRPSSLAANASEPIVGWNLPCQIRLLGSGRIDQ